MPSRNVLKVDAPRCFYHVYARGNSKQKIFLDDNDYATFLNLLKRYLSIAQQFDKKGEPYPHLYSKIEVLCFCLMPNHFHLLLFQEQIGAMTMLMRGVMTSYSRYFNKKYDRSGALFESRYKASLISNHTYLEHISRYIHLNPRNWRYYKFSSLPYYRGVARAEWVQTSKISNLFRSTDEYLTFVEDYEDQYAMFNEIKHELADSDNY